MCEEKRARTRLERAAAEHIHYEVSAQVNRELELDAGYAWAFTKAMYKECCNTEEEIAIFEWWTVSEDFAYHATSACEVVVSTPFGKVWGRQTTGQRLVQDFDVQMILEKILQSHSE